MNKTIKFLLFLIILTINSLVKSFDITKLFDPEDVKRQAALNIQLHKQVKKVTKQKIAEEEEEWERRQKFFTSLIKGGAYIAFNTLKFGYKLITKTNKTIERLKKGNPNVVTGFIGLTTTSLLGIIYYNKYKEQQKKNVRKNEETRKKDEENEKIRRKEIRENQERLKKEREDKEKEDIERAKRESLAYTTSPNSPPYNPSYYNEDGTSKNNLYPYLPEYNKR